MSDPSAADILRSLNEPDEHPRQEAKSGVGKAALKTISAYSNEPRLGGGYLLIGVARADDDSDRRYYVRGLEDPDRAQADLARQCASVFNRAARPKISVEQLDRKPVLKVFVPELPRGEKPLFFEDTGLPRGAFRRIGSTDQRCTEDDLLIFFGEGHPAYDQTPVADGSLADIDPEALDEYRRQRASTNASAPELEWSNEDLLKALGCVVNVMGNLYQRLLGFCCSGSSPKSAAKVDMSSPGQGSMRPPPAAGPA